MILSARTRPLYNDLSKYRFNIYAPYVYRFLLSRINMYRNATVPNLACVLINKFIWTLHVNALPQTTNLSNPMLEPTVWRLMIHYDHFKEMNYTAINKPVDKPTSGMKSLMIIYQQY